MYRLNIATGFSHHTIALPHPEQIQTVYRIEYQFEDEQNKILNHELFKLYNMGSLYDKTTKIILVRNISKIKKITNILIKNKIIEWTNQ